MMVSAHSWELETGRVLRTLRGHADDIHGVAMIPDPRRGLRVWGQNAEVVGPREIGGELRTLEGHSACVHIEMAVRRYGTSFAG
jgi:hypothetical protein